MVLETTRICEQLSVTFSRSQTPSPFSAAGLQVKFPWHATASPAMWSPLPLLPLSMPSGLWHQKKPLAPGCSTASGVLKEPMQLKWGQFQIHAAILVSQCKIPISKQCCISHSWEEAKRLSQHLTCPAWSGDHSTLSCARASSSTCSRIPATYLYAVHIHLYSNLSISRVVIPIHQPINIYCSNFHSSE